VAAAVCAPFVPKAAANYVCGCDLASDEPLVTVFQVWERERDIGPYHFLCWETHEPLSLPQNFPGGVRFTEEGAIQCHPSPC
jgi:hypothetical protein